ncbi:a-amylase [Gongronella butleri]|nr:a-amylase [Gongronella butleri]
MKLKLFLLTSLSFVFASPFDKRATAEEWRLRTVYQVFTDRFARSDATTPGCSVEALEYCGGTWKGIQSKLDYISGMGFDAIWISPISLQTEGGYHGYIPKVFEEVNPYFGTKQELKDLVKAAHKRGMYVMLDAVANHQGFPPSPGNFTGFTFDKVADYHPQCAMDFENQTSVEQCWLLDLPDLNTENPAIVKKLNGIVHDWVSTFGFDGLRIDTMRHVRKEFWIDYIASAGVFATGEVFEPDPAYAMSYMEVSPSVLNYPLYSSVIGAFTNETKMTNMTALQAGWQAIQDAPGVWANFVDNHDNARIQNKTNDVALTKNALAFTLMVDGVSIVYYGTEQGLHGGGDPHNREALWADAGYDTTTDMYKFLTTLIKKGRQPNIKGKVDGKGHVSSDASVLTFRRGNALVVVNNYGSGVTKNVTVDASGLNVSTLQDIFSKQRVIVANGTVKFQIKDGHPAIFV